MCFSIENFIIYTLLVGYIYTELKINEVRYKICDDLSLTFGYVRLFSDLSCIINIILLQEKKKFSVNVMQFYALIVRVAILVIRMMIVPQNTVLIQMI